ncbi:hypothetical protein MBT42_38970 [Streptomyces sp. MBT42]|uniref:hypothetical protein n=1 Tax=Streptomyces sp. MBT42 TaxID=1488373 RepID=UPI001E3125FB|nr:hypothetical protein [Streptomyces sp. MBT42]MCD2469501.1 hypothetical protein [Streptomyces sp. MBT42]
MRTNTPKPVLTRAAEAETTSDPSSTMTLLADCGTDSVNGCVGDVGWASAGV